jgi:outer membrane protein OmpA-like peptidoglycan-associated protein
MRWFNLKMLATGIGAAALLGCSSPSEGANDSVASVQDAVLADEQHLSALRDEFIETAGKDFVEFKEGSAALDPAAQFRLERQALWLRAYPMISVRLAATGDGIERIADRRLAMARGNAVRKYLIEVGVQNHQVETIDVASAPPRQKRRVTTQIDFIQSSRNE